LVGEGGSRVAVLVSVGGRIVEDGIMGLVVSLGDTGIWVGDGVAFALQAVIRRTNKVIAAR
jgi:hypothetical protein